jgi:hypothetical protein
VKDSLDTRTAADGSIEFAVVAAPGSARERVVGLLGTALKVAVNAPPERGKANEAVCRLIERFLGGKSVRAEVVSGHASKRKRVAVTGTGTDRITAAVAALEDR